MNCALHHPQAQLQQQSELLCQATIGNVLFIGLLPSLSGADLAASACQGKRSGLAVMLWLTLFIGCILPLHITVWYERRIKTFYVKRRTPTHASPGYSWLQQRVAWLMLWALTSCLIVVALMDLDVFDVRHCDWTQQ